jgi:ketosteroid isomerase-like protein
MTRQEFRHWLDRYGDAWVAGDPDAVAELFAEDARYYETPFEEPLRGVEAIRTYWIQGAKDAQTSVSFDASLIAVDGSTGYARWRATFERLPSRRQVVLDGVLEATFDEDGNCREFREWWHRHETPDP